MKIIKMPLILFGFNILIIACTSHQNKHKDESILIECSAAYTNLELYSSIMQTDSMLNIRDKTSDNPGNQHPLLSLLRLNIYQDDSGSFFLATSSFIGFAASNDTSAITDYLKKSPFFPDSVTYNWFRSNGPVEEFGLIAHRNHEIKRMLSNDDIESMSIEQKAGSSASGLTGLIHAGFIKKLKIKLNESGMNKIKEILTTDAILLSMNIGNKSMVISQPADQLKEGILFTDQLTKSFIDKLMQMYPTLMKQE